MQIFTIQLSYSNFTNVDFDNVIFQMEIFLTNCIFENSSFYQIIFNQTNLLNSKINLTDSSLFTIDNVILPNGTWIRSRTQFIQNGNAESNVSTQNDSFR